MKIMTKFEIEELKLMSYALLRDMDEKLNKSLGDVNKFKEFHRRRGEITKAADFEATAIRVKENISSVRLVMFLKETYSLESFQFGNEPLSLN